MLAAAVGAGEEVVLAAERDRADRALDDIGVDLDAAVVEEAGEPVPARERVADRPGDGRLAGDGGELGFQPQTQSIDERLAAPLPRLAAFVGGQAANVGFDGIERSDADQRLGGDRCRRLRLDVVELPPHMAPAEGEYDVAGFGEVLIGAVAVDLQRAAEAFEMPGRPRVLAVGCIDIGDARRSVAGPGPLVACIGPQLALLDAPASG